MKTIITAAGLVLGFSAAALAHHQGAIDLSRKAPIHHPGEVEVGKDMVVLGNLVVSHAYALETTSTAHGAPVYLTIENQGQEADRLISASVDFAESAAVQGQTVTDDGTLEVRDLKAVAVQSGQVLNLQPGTAWIELESLQQDLERGQRFDLTLTFEHAGTLVVEVLVEEADHDDREEEPAT